MLVMVRFRGNARLALVTEGEQICLNRGSTSRADWSNAATLRLSSVSGVGELGAMFSVEVVICRLGV